MNKAAQTDHPIDILLARRWSPRAFAERMVEKEKLRALLEAARWAPSCYNAQPWSFIVATREAPQEFERLLHCLKPLNIRWAKHAPVLMLSVARLTFEHNDQPNRHAMHDVGLAVANLVLQASALEIFVHQMAGFDLEQARASFAIPETHAPVAAIAVGYVGDPATLPDDLRAKEVAPRERKPLHRFVFSGAWNHQAALLHK